MNPITSAPVLSSESKLVFWRQTGGHILHPNNQFPLVPPRSQGSEGQLSLVQGKYPLAHLQTDIYIHEPRL